MGITLILSTWTRMASLSHFWIVRGELEIDIHFTAFLVLQRFAQIVAAWQSGGEKMQREWENEVEMEREWGNGEKTRKWRENEQMEKDSLSTFPHFHFKIRCRKNFTFWVRIACVSHCVGVSEYIYLCVCVRVSRPSAFGGSLRQVCQAWVRTSLHLQLSWSQSLLYFEFKIKSR